MTTVTAENYNAAVSGLLYGSDSEEEESDEETIEGLRFRVKHALRELIRLRSSIRG